MTPSSREFARHMAVQQVGYWRTAVGPKTRAYHRRQALYFMRVARTGRI